MPVVDEEVGQLAPEDEQQLASVDEINFERLGKSTVLEEIPIEAE